MRKTPIVWLFVLTILYGCSVTSDNLDTYFGDHTETLLSISEAKSAFEQAYSLALTKSGHKVERKNKLSPGEFTPVWDCATFSENPDACSFDIQIIPERKIYAITAEFRNGRSIAKKVRVSQRLVTVKTKKYGRTCCYLMSLIPDCTYNDGSNAIEHFYNCGQKDNFSGLAIYSTLVSDCVIGIDRYINGIKKDNVYIPKGKGSVHSRIEKAASMLKGICLVNHRIVSTKSFGEDFWDDDYDDNWDYGNPDDYTDVGDGYFEDGDGNLYYDTDGDGVPDSMVIEGGGIDGNGNEGGNDGTDDSWWLWNPDSENNGESDSEDDPYYNMDGDSDEPSETEETENDNETDEDYEKPKRLEKYYGTKEYYEKRVEDFNSRHQYDTPMPNPPDYYLSYGYEYCRQFNEVTKPELYTRGQKWVNDVTYALQVALDDILEENANIELDPDLLLEKAFESHVNAYENCGVFELDMHDKILILLTIGIDDILTEDGLRQVKEVIEDQIDYYYSHMDDAINDALFLMNHYQWVLEQLRGYINNNTTTPETKSSTSITEEDLLQLFFGPLIDFYENNVPEFQSPYND